MTGGTTSRHTGTGANACNISLRNVRERRHLGKPGRENNFKIHINFWPIGSKHSWFVTDTCTSRVRCVNFHENPSMNAEIQPRRNTVLQVNSSLLLADGNQTCIIYSACVESAGYNILGKPLQWKSKYSQKGTPLLMSIPLTYPRIEKKLARLSDIRGECEVWISRKILPIEGEKRPRRRTALQ